MFPQYRQNSLSESLIDFSTFYVAQMAHVVWIGGWNIAIGVDVGGRENAVLFYHCIQYLMGEEMFLSAPFRRPHFPTSLIWKQISGNV